LRGVRRALGAPLEGWARIQAMKPTTIRSAQLIVRAIADLDPGLPAPIIVPWYDELVLELWCGCRKLSIYIGEQGADFIKIWGPDVNNQMVEGQIENTETLANLCKWLRG
jgi:hypothetical protein